MSHRAALYTVRVRPHGERDEWRPLGNYDDRGTWAGTTIAAALASLNDPNWDETVHVRFDSVLPCANPNHVGISFLSGKSGITSVIERDGEEPFHRLPDHSEEIRTAVLFNLPRPRIDGLMALHIPHNRSCKSILEGVLRTAFGDDYMIELNPIVPRAAYREAVEQNRISKVTLVKRNPTADDQFLDAAQWGPDEVDRLELIITSRRRQRLFGDPIRRFLDNPDDPKSKQIIEFEGLEFDALKVTVDMPEGNTRTFHLEALDALSGGHPITYELDINSTDEYGGTVQDLTDELSSTLVTVLDEL